MKLNPLLFCLALINFMTACKKDHESQNSTTNQLPAITQIGANTFGCLVNGIVFINGGSDGIKPNYRLFVDPTFQNGSFQLRIYNYRNSNYVNIDINSNDIHAIGTYNVFGNNGPVYIDYSNDDGNCNFNQSATCYLKGKVEITRYDLTNEIFSGTFEFDLKDPTFNCDTIHITQGRFDKRL